MCQFYKHIIIKVLNDVIKFHYFLPDVIRIKFYNSSFVIIIVLYFLVSFID